MKGYKQFALQFNLNDTTGLHLGTKLGRDIYFCYHVLHAILRGERLTELALSIKAHLLEKHWEVADAKQLRDVYYEAIVRWIEINRPGTIKHYKVTGIEVVNALQIVCERVAAGSDDLNLYFSYSQLQVTEQLTYELSEIAAEMERSGELEYTLYVEVLYFTVLSRCKYPRLYQ